MANKLETVNTQRLRWLAEVRTDEPTVLSLYINLDPSDFPTPKARQSEITSLIDDARARAETEDLSHDGRKALNEAIGAVENWAKSVEADGARGFAVFACPGADVFEVFKLPTPMGPEVHIDRTAYLEPLRAALPTHDWCVFLVNRRDARILRGSRDRMTEVATLSDDVHGQHDQGGWSQARYQRSVEKDVADHVKHGCDRLFEEFRWAPFDKLLVGCPNELWPEVSEKLHSYLTDRLVTHFDADLMHETADDVVERARPLIEEDERRREKELVEKLAERLGRGERGASGLERVLEALNMDAVDVLLLDPAFQAGGVICPRCGWLGTAGDECPADGTKVEQLENVVEAAVAKTMSQSGTVHEVRYSEPGRALDGRIAALLRY